MDVSRREMLKLGVGIGAGLAALGTTGGFAFAMEGKTLKLIHHKYTQDWSPLRGGGARYFINSLWWASPMYYDAESKLHPYVFTSWVPSENDTVWTFKLDPKATFSDGSKITAADVIGSWALSAMPATKNQRIAQVVSKIAGYDDVSRGKARDLKGATAPDDETIVVTLSSPDPIFFMRLANHIAPITKVSQSRGPDGDEVYNWFTPGEGAVYSGPFKLTSIDLDGGHLVMEANENFFGPKPKISRIEIDTVEDDIAAIQLLKAGTYQGHTSGMEVPTLSQDLGQYFVGGPYIPRSQHYWFNAKRAPMNDINVRKALVMAIDRDGLIKATAPDGPEVKADEILFAVPGAKNTGFEPYPFDPEKARALLAESSYGGPERLPKIMFVGISNPTNEAGAQFIAEQWRQNLGITAIDMKPQADSYSGPDQNAIQIFRDDVSSPVPDPVTYLEGAIASSSGNARRKMGGYKNEKVDALLAEASTLSMDDPRRIALAQEAQRVFREDWMFIPWYHIAVSRSVISSVKNFDRNLNWQIVAPWNITIE